MPLGLGTTEIALIIILIIILILVPSKLPQFARSIGESIREFRRASREISEEDKEAVREIKRGAEGSKIDEETLHRLAEKLGIDDKGKSKEELVEEILNKAKEKGLV